ncbi:hypothetical protein TNIN_20941 [Trichonephila inaurata madagascariensis]|uniref:EF-hand domain-containing protein n=1 Tax=Trichonephila inaurata madagascariensis TaxID=2747483 RepID=A0A8X7CF53_9ARAC|nr:hypothetical protein TNIN_20941 [Trichonephila inaurata madagascariensis]
MTASHEHHYPNFNELPPKEQQRLQKLFKQLDVTNDNKITAEDLAVAFKQMGIPYHPEGCIQLPIFTLFNDSLNTNMLHNFEPESNDELSTKQISFFLHPCFTCKKTEL